MKTTDNSVRAPRHLGGNTEERNTRKGNVGDALYRAKRRLLTKRIFYVFLLLVLIAAALWFVFSGSFDSLVQLLVKEIG